MNEINCTCGSHSCYSCRYQVILDTAIQIAERETRICAGMTGFDVEAHAWSMANLYRCNALNALALEFMGR